MPKYRNYALKHLNTVYSNCFLNHSINIYYIIFQSRLAKTIYIYIYISLWHGSLRHVSLRNYSLRHGSVGVNVTNKNIVSKK